MPLDPEAPYPPYLQVAATLRREIAEGEVKPGDRLPPAHDMAAVLGVNRNTVLRALHQLRDEGLLEFRRGRGITVVGNAPARNDLVSRCRDLLRYSRTNGYSKDEILRIIEGLP
jgi:GntR family transcriptional regulator